MTESVKQNVPPERKVCMKCGFDHNYPGSQLGAIQVLACAFRDDPSIEFVTRYGKVRPATVIKLKDEEGEAEA